MGGGRWWPERRTLWCAPKPLGAVVIAGAVEMEVRRVHQKSTRKRATHG